ncbi:MAG: 50S ribosome-binding GTPase, partial [Desulfobacterales bacterium]|nr:50S ribosome-binding GTPase [Desulfobacterales bacterium]
MIHEETLIKAEGRIAGLQQELESIIQALEPLTGWKPRASLLAQCRLISETLSSIAERMDRKLVVTIIGGVGIGKSTLFNAIAGMDDLSPTGHQRPTTRNFVVLCEQREDARFLIDDMGSETIRVVSGPDAHAFPNMILIDTPDTDSAENLRHHELIGQILHHTDVLLCGFSARNPKRRDHIDFMRPFVDAYPKDQLFVVLTECDRVLETELNDIIQDFRACLQTGWDKDVKRIFAVSARAFLKAPGWDETAMPLHPFNEYPALKSMLTDELNSPGAYISTRTKRCDHLMAFLRQQISASIRVPEIRA